ncbi:hypothetical protein [Winogradskyella schleiferi]|uniref:hypothetical protein n=1 Tax=Winogradskyella schleiferi TaxID=2686078 RepID=UPI0015BB22E3|nr:hypothetical protein [Winogradskyella schleiferi]
MRYIYILLILGCFSCNNERVLQLPEIENAEVTEVLDVSPAYIFYDETQPDSTLLNRKNLITTTNWLVNVDKRLTLRQAIPHIKFLQDKKRNAEMHKNEDAKNYFTCNDTSIGTLGFLEFTDVNYTFSNDEMDFRVSEIIDDINLIKRDTILIEKLSKTSHKGPDITQVFEVKFDLNDIYFGATKIKRELLSDYVNFLIENNILTDFFILKLYFNKSLLFQDYISLKSELSKLESDKITIDINEFIY